MIVHSHMTMGDPDFTYEEGLEKAREQYGRENIVALEEEYDTPRISHCHIELPVSWAYVDTNGKVKVVCSILYGAVRLKPLAFLSERSASLSPISAAASAISRMCSMSR